jgi:hypothetical protein
MRSNLLVPSILLAISLCAQAQMIEIPAVAGTISPPFYISGGVVTQTNDTEISQGGKAVYTFAVTNAGEYVIYAVVGGRSGKACALKVSVNEEADGTNGLWQFLTSDKAERRAVGSTKAANHRDYDIFNLSAGTHQLLVRGSTAGTKLEKFYIRPNKPPTVPGTPHVSAR